MIILAYYKDLNSLFAKLKEDIHESLATDVFDDVIDMQQEEIQTKVYDAYDDGPFVYERRYEDGGLLDKRNNIATFYHSGDGVEMLIQNITKGHPRYKYADTYIVPIIVGGDGAYGMNYDFPYNRLNTQYKFLNSRDFISSTKERLKSENMHVISLEQSLASKGYRFY